MGISELQSASDRLQKTASLAPGLIFQFILDKDGTMGFLYASYEVAKLFRVSAEEIHEDVSKFFSVIHPDDYDDFLVSLYTSAQEMTPWKKEFRVSFDDGSGSMLYVLATPEKIDDGSTHWHGFIIDMSDITNKYEGLVQSKEASTAQVTQNHLLSMIAHEFRPPLSLLMSSIDIINRYAHDLSPDKLTLQHQNIFTATQRMTELLESIFVFCHRDNHQEYAPTTVDCTLVCRDVAQEIQAGYGERYQFTITIEDDCGMAKAEESSLRRVVTNLLENAFRFTPPGGNISFQARRENRRLLMVITDSGIGIPEEDHQRVFEPFQRSSNALSYQGIGLGLSNVATALSQMGGTILLSSRIGEGTTVRVEIPLAVKDSHKVSNSLYSILIVEDDELLRSNMELVLQMEGYDVRIAENGLSGLAMIRERRPDLVLCDIFMPEMDGYEFLETVKKDPLFANIYFIFVTALSDHADLHRGMLASVDDYLTKPFKNTKLLATIRDGLHKHKIHSVTHPPVSPEDDLLLQTISRREREILLMVGHGYTSKDIADQLFISLKTVETHRSRLMKKLGATNAVVLARWAAIAEQIG